MAARGGRKQLSRCVRALDEDQGEHKSCCLCLCRILVAYLTAGNIGCRISQMDVSIPSYQARLLDYFETPAGKSVLESANHPKQLKHVVSHFCACLLLLV